MKRKPPAKPLPSKQYDLFTQFFGNTDNLSNTIELWDAIPKYAVSARRQLTIRDDKRRLPVHEYQFVYADRPCRIEVQPASIKVNGEFQDFYPSVDEELVEEVIRKVFADQRYGVHIAPVSESWVKFSLQMIRKELQARGKTRSLDEIKRSIDILANSTLRLYVDGEGNDAIYTSPILSDLTRVSRAAYTDDPSALWVARLPALISKSVNELSYRQFNYGTLMTLTSQFGRWLHKRLCHQYINAGVLNQYGVLYSTLCRDSGLLTANRVTKNMDEIEAALNELKSRDVLMDWKKDVRRGGRNKIEDVLYTLSASMTFIAEMKAANGRMKNSRTVLSGSSPKLLR